MASHRHKVAVLGRLGFWPTARLSIPARRLVAYMAIRGGTVSRSRASDELWPDLPEDTGRANLRRSLWQTPRDWITAAGDELLLDAECDLCEARGAAARGIQGQRLTFDEIGLLSHDVLPGWHEDWAIEAHEEFRLIRVQALEASCRTFSKQENHALAVQAGAAAVAAEPLCESAVRALIEAHLAQHNRFDAIQCYRQLERRLAKELGVTPEPQLSKLISGIGNRTAA